MAGNVWQWVEDCYDDNYEGAPTDGAARITGHCPNQVIRGGAWDSQPYRLRSASRGWLAPGNQVNNVGFRLARTLTP